MEEKNKEKFIRMVLDAYFLMRRPLPEDGAVQQNRTTCDIQEELEPMLHLSGEDIIDYMNKYPQAKVQVDGYADAGTGNDRINDRLAAQRADVVVKALQDKGIAADRISYGSHGSRVQPFAENDLNRVSICIANAE